MADNYYYHMYVETQETRELREQHNLRETGEKSATSEAEPTMIELPTAAGSVMLDLSDPQQGGSAQSGPSGAMRAGTGPLRSRDQLGKLGRNSSGLGKKDKSKRKKGGGEEEENPTGGARDKRSSQDEGDLFSRRDDEDEIPPLTAEVCACTAVHCCWLAPRTHYSLAHTHVFILLCVARRRRRRRARRGRRC